MRSLSFLFVAILAILGVGALAQRHSALPAVPLGPTPAATGAFAPPAQAQPAATGAAPMTAQDVTAWLDGFVPYAIGTGDIAGAVVVVVKDGQVLAERGYGFADVASRKPVDAERTLFR